MFCPFDVYSEEINDVENHNNQTKIHDNFIIKYSAGGGITAYYDNIVYNYTENHLIRLESNPERSVSETISDIQLNDSQKQTLRKMIEEGNMFDISFKNEKTDISDGFSYRLDLISGNSSNTILWTSDNYENSSRFGMIPLEIKNLNDLLHTYLENSIRLYTEVDIVAIENQNVNALLIKADSLLAQKNYTEAIFWYDKVLAKESEETHALIYKAHALSSLGQHEKALTLVEKVLSLQPDYAYDPWAILEKGIILSNMGQYDDALIWANKALEANPTNNAPALILKKEIEGKIK